MKIVLLVIALLALGVIASTAFYAGETTADGIFKIDTTTMPDGEIDL